MKPGTRVLAIRDADADTKTANVYGYGTYDGDLPCPFLSDRPNPHITLDDGTIVWGAQCWWGEANDFDKRLAAFTKVTVPVEEPHNPFATN